MTTKPHKAKHLIRTIVCIALAAIITIPANALDEATLDFFAENNILYYDPDGGVADPCPTINTTPGGSCAKLGQLRSDMWYAASEQDHRSFMAVVSHENHSLVAVEGYMNQALAVSDGDLNHWLTGGQCTNFMAESTRGYCTDPGDYEISDKDQTWINMALNGSNRTNYAVGNATGGSEVGAGKIVCVWKSDDSVEGGSCRTDIDLSKEDGRAACNVFSSSPEEGECWGRESSDQWASSMAEVCTANSGSAAADVPKYIWNWLKTGFGQTLSDEAVAGIMGNMQHESHLLPTMHQGGRKWSAADLLASGGGKAFGLIQFDNKRRTTMLKKLQAEKPHLMKYIEMEYSSYSFGYNYGDGVYTMPTTPIPEADFNELLQFNLDYLKFEHSDEYYDASYERKMFKEFIAAASELTGEAGVIRATWAYNKYVERSGSSDAGENGIPDRTNPAKAFYNLFQGTASGCSGNAGTTIAKIGIWLAWPDATHNQGGSAEYYCEGTYLDPRPEYIDVRKEVGSARSGSGCRDAGADCANFVSTVLLYWAGDPNFKKDLTTYYMKQYFADQVVSGNSPWKEIENLRNDSNLQPGDVFINNNGSQGHAMIYIGDLGGNGFNMVDARLNSHVPSYSKNIYFKGGGGDFKIYRFVGTAAPNAKQAPAQGVQNL